MVKIPYINKNREMMIIGTEFKSKGGIAAVVSGYDNAGTISRQKIDDYLSHCDGKSFNGG